MAVPLQAARRLLRLSGGLRPASSRSMFTARKHDTNNPNWVNVGLTFASTVGIWALLFKEHNDHIVEYERRQTERGS